MPLGSRSMQLRPLCKCVAAAHHPAPPLIEAHHRCVMERHLGFEPPQAPASGAQPDAKFGLLAGDQTVAVSIDSSEGLDPHHHVTAKCPDLASRSVPFLIAQP